MEKTANPLVQYFWDAIPHFLAYFGTGIALSLIFLTLYVLITPHKEFELIKNGNNAAATQLVGSFFGFILPVGMVFAHSVSLFDAVLWSCVALVVQLIVFFVIAKLFAGIEKRIDDNCQSSGTFVGGLSLGFGILQAACMVP